MVLGEVYALERGLRYFLWDSELVLVKVVITLSIVIHPEVQQPGGTLKRAYTMLFGLSDSKTES